MASGTRPLTPDDFKRMVAHLRSERDALPQYFEVPVTEKIYLRWCQDCIEEAGGTVIWPD